MQENIINKRNQHYRHPAAIMIRKLAEPRSWSGHCNEILKRVGKRFCISTTKVSPEEDSTTFLCKLAQLCRPVVVLFFLAFSLLFLIYKAHLFGSLNHRCQRVAIQVALPLQNLLLQACR